MSCADRLEAILTIHRPDSAFNRWRRGELERPPVEVSAVLMLAQQWFERTAGAFNPCLGEVMRRWRRAEAEQRVPDRGELLALAAQAQVLPFDVVGDGVVAVGDRRTIDVHGVAKGWVVDQLVAASLEVRGVRSVLVDIGGDVRCAGPAGGSVALEDPFAVADNVAPLAVIRLAESAVATSGGGRRGWRVDGRWFGHLIDPWTGWPLPHRRSCSVVAATAADADAAVSAFAVLDDTAAQQLAAGEEVAVLRVSEVGGVWRSPRWRGAID